MQVVRKWRLLILVFAIGTAIASLGLLRAGSDDWNALAVLTVPGFVLSWPLYILAGGVHGNSLAQRSGYG